MAGAELRIGDRLITGNRASAVVCFADRSTVFFGSDSELVLDRLAQYQGTGMVDTRLRLERGRLETAVQPPAGGGSYFEVWTLPAVSSVRGADLRVGHDEIDELSATGVLTGTVDVVALATVRRAPEGFGTVSRQGEPPAPTPAAPAASGRGSAAQHRAPALAPADVAAGWYRPFPLVARTERKLRAAPVRRSRAG